MNSQATAGHPVRYEPSVEVKPDDEDETIQDLIRTMTKIQEITYKDGGHAIRSVHAKSFGLLNATLIVSDGLPPELAQGLFARPGRYPVIARFSSVPGDLLHDKVSTPRGLSLKVLGIEGERLSGAEGSTTQDFVMVNGPAFGAPTPKKFLSTLKQLAATTDKAPGLKQALSAALQVVEKGVEALGGKSPTLIQLGGHPETHVLGETYYTQAPMRYGDYIAKLSVVPASAPLKALTGAKVDLDDKPNGLREAVEQFFVSNGGEWDVRIQLNTDLEKMPVEDASVEWDEEASPFRTVATLVANEQPAWNEERSSIVDDRLAFSPWHGIEAHRPLGGVMRARKQPYDASARFRAAHNGVSIEEPAGDVVLP